MRGEVSTLRWHGFSGWVRGGAGPGLPSLPVGATYQSAATAVHGGTQAAMAIATMVQRER
ncbi:hypothetical protein IB69_018385 [Xanthomonas citri]|nr:hypothetical protein IB69_018385 [Xanthomonas citri]PPT90412.1 hypothetical protein XaraCFBP7407_22590 [Xanthomonas arboricola pv. arracaciae]